MEELTNIITYTLSTGEFYAVERTITWGDLFVTGGLMALFFLQIVIVIARLARNGNF